MYKQTYLIEKDDYNNAGKISSQLKQTFKQLGFEAPLIRRMAVASYEAEINMIIHSLGGEISVLINEEKVILSFNDKGPGIVDIEKALTAGYSTASSKAREFGFGAGMGLPNIKRVSDEFSITSSPEGTLLEIGFNVS
ncbi:MAG: anti-sigma regulatory factor [Erysipelotrichaceae bacterium]